MKTSLKIMRKQGACIRYLNVIVALYGDSGNCPPMKLARGKQHFVKLGKNGFGEKVKAREGWKR